jgi:tetratricopeptide (TPR) repeat protein
MTNLATLKQLMGEGGSALRLYRRAEDVFRRARGAWHPETAQSLNNLAVALHAKGRFSEAATHYRRAIRIYERLFGDDPHTAQALDNLSVVLHSLGKMRQAKASSERAARIFEETLGRAHPNSIGSMINLGTIQYSLGFVDDAHRTYTRALKALGRVRAELPSVRAALLYNLGTLMFETGRQRREAVNHLIEACSLFESACGRENVRTQRARAALAEMAVAC